MLVTPLPLCSKCHERPRREGQRWCSQCALQYKLARYHRQRAETGPGYEEIVPTVIPAPPPTAKPIALCFRCGYGGAWHERTSGVWVCGLCNVPPAT